MKKLRYRKSMNHNYLVADKNGGDDWQLDMLLENHIPGLLPVSLRMNEGQEELYYEISSLQPLSRIYEHKEMRLEEAGHLLAAVSETVRKLQEYMLGGEGLLLGGDVIFTDPEELSPSFLYLPCGGNSLREQLLELAEYLMEHMEQSDAASSIWAYQLYKRLRNENFVLSDLEEYLREKGEPEPSVIRQPVFTEEELPEKETAPEPFDEEEPAEELVITMEEKKEEKEAGEKMSWWKRLLFGNKKEKTKKPVPRKAEPPEEDTEPAEQYDFSAAFAGLETEADNINPAPEDYGKTVFLGEADEPVENVLAEKRSGKRIPMDHFPFFIGKMKERVDLPLSDGSVSRIHARIRLQNGRAFLQDCHSTNGTFVNGIQLESEEEVMLERDDEIRFGRVVFSYC
ncbi:MAG: FHA domain-containing protein [Lachnospiraceae bacterium]|nr:FHA domain-containing protein [Lachnospiraceae bacterium]